MTAFIALFTGLCGFKKKKQPLETIKTGNQSSPLKTNKREQTSDDLQNKETNDLQNTEIDDNISVANPDLPLPPARKEALRSTYSCNNMVLRKSMSTKKKLSASLTIQMTRALSMTKRHDRGEEDKSVRKQKPKAENSILVRPIILGERCKVPLDEDEDHSQKMPKNNRMYRPRSMSSISISRTNSKSDMNVIPVEVTSEDDSMKTKEHNY